MAKDNMEELVGQFLPRQFEITAELHTENAQLKRILRKAQAFVATCINSGILGEDGMKDAAVEILEELKGILKEDK